MKKCVYSFLVFLVCVSLTSCFSMFESTSKPKEELNLERFDFSIDNPSCPFGIEMGWTIQNMESNGIEVIEKRDNSYVLELPNKDLFDKHTVKLDSDSEVCNITAVMFSTEENVFAACDVIKKQLILEYGVASDEIVDPTIGMYLWNPSDRTYGMKIMLLILKGAEEKWGLQLTFVIEDENVNLSEVDAAEAAIL